MLQHMLMPWQTSPPCSVGGQCFAKLKSFVAQYLCSHIEYSTFETFFFLLADLPNNTNFKLSVTQM